MDEPFGDPESTHHKPVSLSARPGGCGVGREAAVEEEVLDVIQADTYICIY